MRKTPQHLHRAPSGNRYPIREAFDDPERITNGTTGSTYDGAELRHYDGRPGAMDAYRLPSRIGRSLYWRDGKQGFEK